MPADDRPRDLTSLPFPELLAELSKGRFTGVLQARSTDCCRRVVFDDGDVRSVVSDAEDERLGSWLVVQGRINDGDRAITLFSQGSGEDAKPLGELLIERGVLEQQVLHEELRALALAIVTTIASDPDQSFELEDAEIKRSRKLPRLPTSEIILTAARSYRDLDMMRKNLGDSDQPVWPSRDLDSLLAEATLTPTEAFLLSRLGGTDSVSNLIRLSSLPEEQAVATLYALVTTGVLVTGPTPHPVPAPEYSRSLSSRRDQPQLAAVDEATLSEAEINERRQILEIADLAPRMDHYRALGLMPDASSEDIGDAWASMQERYDAERLEQDHLKDLGGHFETIVERAREAHEVLANPKAKRRYDPILEAIENERKSMGEVKVRGKTDDAARKELVEANFQRATELVRDGEIYLAIQMLEQACAIDPRPTELLNLARLLLRNPLWTNRALNYIRRATQADPGLVEGWIELAEFWRRRSNPDEQRKALEKALNIDPQNTRATTMFRLLTGRRELGRLQRRIKARKS